MWSRIQPRSTSWGFPFMFGTPTNTGEKNSDLLMGGKAEEVAKEEEEILFITRDGEVRDESDEAEKEEEEGVDEEAEKDEEEEEEEEEVKEKEGITFLFW
jgi:hypothetical protein